MIHMRTCTTTLILIRMTKRTPIHTTLIPTIIRMGSMDTNTPPVRESLVGP